jgi:hypothetical protein
MNASRLLVLACLVLTPAATAQDVNVSPPLESPRGDNAQITDAVTDGTALQEGNRLFRTGQYEAAAAAYRAGLESGLEPTLAYNHATALHHLGRLPEAVLWYRRAEKGGDPWLADNLLLARRSLDSRTLTPAGFVGFLASSRTLIGWTAAGLAWLAFLGLALHERVPGWAAGTMAAVALVLFLTAAGAGRWGPRPAVLLQDCTATANGTLAAGTEAWVSAQPGGGYAVSGTDFVCPDESVALVHPSPD